MKNLIYTVAFDAPDAPPFHQMMAKMLVSSILRTGFQGDVLILTNAPTRIFEYRRPRVSEMSFDTGKLGAYALREEAQRFKFGAHRYVKAKAYEKIMFVDCDCLFMNSPDALFQPEADLAYCEEIYTWITGDMNNAYLTEKEMKKLDRPAINSGVWWIRREHFKEVLTEWQRIDQSSPLREKWSGDQPAFVRLILDTPLQTIAFKYRQDVGFPFVEKKCLHELDDAVVLHFCAQPTPKKLAHLYGTYMGRFHPGSVFALNSFLNG